MSNWGFWGYVGIVASLVVMLAMALFFLAFTYRTSDTHEKAQVATQGQRPKGLTTDIKRAA